MNVPQGIGADGCDRLGHPVIFGTCSILGRKKGKKGGKGVKAEGLVDVEAASSDQRTIPDARAFIASPFDAIDGDAQVAWLLLGKTARRIGHPFDLRTLRYLIDAPDGSAVWVGALHVVDTTDPVDFRIAVGQTLLGRKQREDTLQGKQADRFSCRKMQSAISNVEPFSRRHRHRSAAGSLNPLHLDSQCVHATSRRFCYVLGLPDRPSSSSFDAVGSPEEGSQPRAS